MNCNHSRKARRCHFFFPYFGALLFSAPVQVILCLAAVTATVMACGWPGTDHSVRFNAIRSKIEFGRLPPLPHFLEDETTRPVRFEYEYDYDEREKKVKEIDQLWESASAAQQRGDLIAMRGQLRDYLKRTDLENDSGWSSLSDVQKRRNSAIDRLDALTALDNGSSVFAVRSYLAARSSYEADTPAEEVRSAIAAFRSDKNLADNALYLEAALLYSEGKETARQAFDLIVERYPRSEKREAALFMAGVISMKESKSYHNAKEYGSLAPLCDDCQDEGWRAACTRFERVIKEYPRGRYAADARGWLGYISMGMGDRVNALMHYYRLLGSGDERAQLEAVTSLRLLRRRAADSEMEQIEARLESEPAAALAYAYHNIYNFAVWKLYDWTANADMNQNNHRAELERIAAFCTRLMRRHPGLAVGGGFALRLAEANLELGNDDEAAKLARRAIASGVKGDDRAQALWVEGVAEHHLSQYQAARQALSALVSEYPNSYLNEGARRYLAMVAEDLEDINGALEQYLALNYSLDVAYFVDVLMTPEQLAGFIKSHPNISERDELLYALGIRYLRDKRWNEARETLLQVRTIGRSAGDEDSYRYEDHENKNRLASKETGWYSRARGIRPQWIEQDLKTAADMERLEKAVESAEGDDAKAEALYQLASYIYQSTLLFYNPAVWRGNRHYDLYDMDYNGTYRRPNEAQLLFEYMQKHDRASRALPIYMEVVRQFPKTRAARDALYTAAVCHDRLSEYNNYWRDIYSSGGYAGDRLVTYKDVRAAYPDYQLPRGTWGWEPATRTVNGGPGWASRPKPNPRPPRRERLLKIILTWVANTWTKITEVCTVLGLWIVRLYEWLWMGFTFSGLLFLWGRATQARRLLRYEFARCESRPSGDADKAKRMIESGRLFSRLDPYLSREKRDEWRAASLEIFYKLKQLACDRPGRAALVLNAATHGLFVALLLRLF